ncbi:MAG: ABC transporter permease [Armatimonadetes bacterium]|nr:ABC transporter permease [Armatimonadota bacterium]
METQAAPAVREGALEEASRRRRPETLLMLVPAFLLLFFFFVVPYGYMIYVSFMTHAAARTFVRTFTLHNYVEVIWDPYHWQVIWRTFGAAAVVTIVSLLLAYPVAYHLARSRGQRQGLLLLAILSPLLVGVVIRSYGWMILLYNTGLINTMLRQLGIIDKPLPLIYNMFGVGVGLLHIYMPFMILTITGTLQTIDPDLELVARSLGAGPAATFFKVIWPLSLPGVFAGTILVFVQAVSAFAIPILLGGFRVITAPILVVQTVIESFNWPLASAMALVLFLLSVAVLGIYGKIMTRLMRGIAA